MISPRAYFMQRDSKCPHCGGKLDATSIADPRDEDRAPEEGDVGVCIHCAGIIAYADRFTLRKPTPEEEKEALSNPEVRLAQLAVRKAQAMEDPIQALMACVRRLVEHHRRIMRSSDRPTPDKVEHTFRLLVALDEALTNYDEAMKKPVSK
jgi:hypothetical protein